MVLEEPRGHLLADVLATDDCLDEARCGVGRKHLRRETDTFNDKQSQTAERKTGDGRGPGDHSSEKEHTFTNNSHKTTRSRKSGGDLCGSLELES